MNSKSASRAEVKHGWLKIIDSNHLLKPQNTE